MILLGEAHAKISLDVSGVTSGARKAASELKALDGLGSNAFGGAEKALQSLESQLAHVGKSQVTIDLTQAIGGTKQLALALDEAKAQANDLSGTSVSINAAEVAGALQQAALAIDGVKQDIASASGMALTVDTGPIIGEVGQADAAVHDLESTLKGVSATPITADTGPLIGEMGQGEAAAHDLENVLQAVSGTAVSADTGPLVGELGTGEAAAHDLENTLQSVSGTSVTADVGPLVGAMGQGEAAARSLADAIKNVDSELTMTGGTIGAFGAAASAGIGVATGGFIDFEAAMRNVNSITGESEAGLSKLSDEVLKISKITGKGPQDLAEALYDLASSGFTGADGLEVLEKAAIAARAGLTSTSTAVKGITAVLNAYGLEASEAGNVSDVLFSIVNQGVVSFEELARNLGNILPLASTLKVSLQEVGAAYSLLTLAGISPAETETAIAATLRAAINPTQELTKAVQEYGYASAEALIQAEGLTGFLNVLREASGGSTEALTSLLGTADATTAVLALLANNGQNYATSLESMNAATQNGATTQAVMNEQMKSTQASIDAAGAAWGRFKVSFGEGIAPIVGLGAKGLTGILDFFTSLPGPVQSAAAILTAFVAVLGVFGGAALLAVPKVVEFIAAIQKLQQMAVVATAVTRLQAAMSALAFVMSPLGLALAGIVVIGALVAKSWYDQKKAADEYNGSLKTLDQTLESIRRKGDKALADSAQASIDLFNGLQKYVDEAVEQLNNIDFADWKWDRVGELVAEGMSPGDAGKQAEQEWFELTNSIGIEQAKITKSNELLNEALNDTTIDVTKYINWRNELLNTALAIEDPIERVKALNTAIDTINSTPLWKFSTAAEESGQAAEEASTKWGKFFGVIKQGIADVAKDVNENLPEQSFLDKVAESLGADKYDWDTFWAQQQANRDANTQSMIERLVKAADKSYAFSDLDNGFASVETGADRAAEAAARFGAVGQQAVAWMEREAAAAAQVALNVSSGVGAMTAHANAAEKAAAATEKIAAAQKEVISQWQQMTGNDDFVSQLNLAGLGNEFTKLAGDIADAGTAMDTVFRVIVGNTNAIKSQAEAIKSWADELINARGEAGRIDELVNKGLITGTSGVFDDGSQYAKAQAAYDGIAAATEKIQDNVDAIQAIQAPFIEGFLTDQATLLEQLRQMPEAQQRVTLGWMDQTSAMQAQQVVAMAAAAANGELGASGKAATQEMIEGLIAVNPFMEDMLTSIGLISRDHEGNIVVNFEGAASVQATLDDLNASLLVIADLLDNGKLDGSIDIEVENRKELEELKALLEAMGGQTYTVTVNAAGNAMKGITKDLILSDGTVVRVPVDLDIQDWTVTPEEWATAQDIRMPVEPVVEGPPDLSGVPPVTVRAQLVFDQGAALGNSVTNAADNAIAAMKENKVTVTVVVDGGELIGALKLDIQNLSNKTVTVTASVDGATLIGALKLDVQNLSNKNVLVMVSVEGADAIAALKSDVDALENATVTITGDNSDAMLKWQAVQNLTDATKWLFIFGDAANAGDAYTAISTLPDVSKWLFIFGDGADAQGAYDEIAGLADITKTLTINVVVNGDPRVALATGGTVPSFGGNTTVARLAELGPELFRTPSGKWGMAMTDGLYPMTPGTYVFTAAQSRRMWEHWTGQSYARGGRVRRDTPTRGERARYGGGGGSVTNITTHAKVTVNTQGQLSDREKLDLAQDIFEAAALSGQIQATRMGR